MKSEIWKLKKRLVLIVSAFCILHSAFAQSDGYAFLCDSNGVGLPGFFLNWSNLVGSASTAQLPTNVVLFVTFQAGTNTVATNTAAQVNAVSNLLAARLNLVTGTGNYNNGTNSSIVGGFSNVVSVTTPLIDSGIIAGGQSNLLYGSSSGNAIFGGRLDRIDYGGWSAIVGGQSNYIATAWSSAILGGEKNNCGGSYSDITGGRLNTILGGNYNFISGGLSNTIGQVYGFNGVYDGPFTASYSTAGGFGAWPIHNSVWIWADNQGALLRSTTTNQFLIRALNGVGINTNNCGTNAFSVFGNADFTSASIQGVSMSALYSFAGPSNALSAAWNYNLNSVSNSFVLQLGTNTAYGVAISNNVYTASNALSAGIIATSNSLVVGIVAVSNDVYTASNALATGITDVSNSVAGIVVMKAFSATLPATYASIGIGFSTPLMPDGNYSVALTPKDQDTAQAILGGMSWWVGAKNSSGFTIYAAYATNAISLNFECIVKENTQ